MKALSFADRLKNEGPNPRGIESLVVNDLLAAGSWQVSRAWNWKRHSHINVLEASTAVSLKFVEGTCFETPDCHPAIFDRL